MKLFYSLLIILSFLISCNNSRSTSSSDQIQPITDTTNVMHHEIMYHAILKENLISNIFICDTQSVYDYKNNVVGGLKKAITKPTINACNGMQKDTFYFFESENIKKDSSYSLIFHYNFIIPSGWNFSNNGQFPTIKIYFKS